MSVNDAARAGNVMGQAARFGRVKHNQLDANSRVNMHYAARNDDVKAVGALLQAGASPNVRETLFFGMTVTHAPLAHPPCMQHVFSLPTLMPTLYHAINALFATYCTGERQQGLYSPLLRCLVRQARV